MDHPMRNTRLPAALCAFVALVGALLWHPHEPDAQTSRVPVYATSATTLTSTGRALAVATNAAAARSALSLGTLATASSVAATDISDSTSVGRSVLTGTASDGRTALGLGSLATASSVASTSISDSTATGRSLITATDAAAARTTLSAVSTARTIAGTDLTADISAATLRSSLSLATIPSTPSTTPIVDLRADVGVTSSSGRVSAWASQGSVGSVSFSQGTAGRQPLLLTNAAPNGGPAVYFDASRTDTLATSYNASLDPSSALTIIFVGAVRTTSCVVYERPYAATHTGNFAEWWLYAGNGTVDLRVNSSTNSQTINDGAGISGWRRPGIHVYRLASGARKYRVNSYDITTSASGATISYTNNIGHRLGTNTSDGEAATMWVYEVLVFSTSLTDAQVLEWDALMSQRWGVPLVFA